MIIKHLLVQLWEIKAIFSVGNLVSRVAIILSSKDTHGCTHGQGKAELDLHIGVYKRIKRRRRRREYPIRGLRCSCMSWLLLNFWPHGWWLVIRMSAIRPGSWIHVPLSFLWQSHISADYVCTLICPWSAWKHWRYNYLQCTWQILTSWLGSDCVINCQACINDNEQ